MQHTSETNDSQKAFTRSTRASLCPMQPTPPSRRWFLERVGSLLSVGFLAAAAGCVAGGPTSDEPVRRSATTTSLTEQCPPSPAPTSAPNPTDDGQDWLRARGNPVTAERSFVDESGYDDDFEYFPENGTVRVVTARGGDKPRSFADWSFEEWGKFRAGHIGRERVRTVTAERLGHDNFYSSLGQPPLGATAVGMTITLYASVSDDEPRPTSTPAVGLERLADDAPRSVEVTVSLDGDAFTHTLPVYVDQWLLVTLLASPTEGCR